MEEATYLPQVFQHWRWQSLTSWGEELSFGELAPVEALPVWRMSLPPQPQAAADTLEQAERQLAATWAALEQVPFRLESLVQNLQAGGQAQFGVPGEMAGERDLLRWLSALEPSLVGFDLQSSSRDEVDQAASQFGAVLNGLLNQMSHLAWVETQFGAQFLARSVVDWDGDVHTLWGGGTSLEQWLWHQRSLRLALASRFALLRMVTLVAQGAAKISLLVTTPGGAFLALPAVWQFINRLLAEAEASKAAIG